MGIVLKFPPQPIDVDRVRTGGETAKVILLPTAATPYEHAKRAYAKAMAAWVNMMLWGAYPPDNTG